MDMIEAITSIVGPKGILLGNDVHMRPNQSWGIGNCPAKAIVRPQNTEELSQVMQCCYEHNQTVVPWGGQTGLVDGTTCSADDIAISMERMNAIESVDEQAGTMVVHGGAILENVQNTAKASGWQFAVDLGARGSAQMGGVISTNAGGNSVIRYGMMREQVLGLEVVLADGTVISSMNEMLKNNAGYDLKHLFIGSEGTLGIVTRAVLRLRPLPRTVQTAFVAIDSFSNLTQLLRRLGIEFEGKLSSFEVMWNNHYRFMVEDIDKHQTFLPSHYPYYVLLECEGSDQQRQEEAFMSVLGELMEEGLIADAVIAQSSQQAEQLWEMRDDIEALVHNLTPLSAFDVSLPLLKMESYIQDVEAELKEKFPDSRLIIFGHLGDGNIHLVVGHCDDKHAVESIVYGNLTNVQGSISAEHGIGLEKREFLSVSRSKEEITLMRTVKTALDPKNLLNPGKVF